MTTLCSIKSIKNILPVKNIIRSINLDKLEAFYSKYSNADYKDWESTIKLSEELEEIVGNPDDSDAFRYIFHRVLSDGKWDEALESARSRCSDCEAWITLVTGLNGIRKSTSCYEPWFQSLASEALNDDRNLIVTSTLPSGNNSYFRQLDYIIATIANEELRQLYNITDVCIYSNEKGNIYKQYRTLAEIYGAILMRCAIRNKMNVMLETSGRDIAMFNYVSQLVDSRYHKLVVHFTIDNISAAESSVDRRMKDELAVGNRIVGSTAYSGNTSDYYRDIINVNRGGPYGSEILKTVQADSDQVWSNVLIDDMNLYTHWNKACIFIETFDIIGHGNCDTSTDSWSARAVSSKTSTRSDHVYHFGK